MDKDRMVMRDFARMIRDFQDRRGLSMEAYAGMLIGSAATVSSIAGIPKEQMLKVAAGCYEQEQQKVANDV